MNSAVATLSLRIHPGWRATLICRSLSLIPMSVALRCQTNVGCIQTTKELALSPRPAAVATEREAT